MFKKSKEFRTSNVVPNKFIGIVLYRSTGFDNIRRYAFYCEISKDRNMFVIVKLVIGWSSGRSNISWQSNKLVPQIETMSRNNGTRLCVFWAPSRWLLFFGLKEVGFVWLVISLLTSGTCQYSYEIMVKWVRIIIICNEMKTIIVSLHEHYN